MGAQVKDNGDHTFLAEFTPKVAGEHRIHVLYQGKPVGGSPFSCKVYDVSAIKVKEASKGVVGKPVTFLGKTHHCQLFSFSNTVVVVVVSVETSNAGPGNLEVTVNSGQVPTSAQAHGLHTYAISFTPKEAKPHEIELKFNAENVPGTSSVGKCVTFLGFTFVICPTGSPFICQVIDSRQVKVSGEGLEKTAVNRQASFVIDVQGPASTIEVRVLSPNRRTVPSAIESVSDSRYSVTYTPVEVGKREHRVGVVFQLKRHV